MKYNIYLLSYNNYYNRQVKKLPTVADYEDYILSEVLNCNFEFSDGIRSQLIVNSSYAEVQPDYMLVVERNADGTDSEKFSRWFIIDSELIRGNQYSFNVKRDICTDFYDLLMNSTYFIQRGYLPNTNDLIFNNEEQSYSRIKQSQKLLRDETFGPWIVGYTPRELELTGDKTISTSVYTDDADITVADLTNWSYYSYINQKIYNDQTNEPYTITYALPISNDINGTNSFQMLYMGIDLKNARNSEKEVWVDGMVYPNYHYATNVAYSSRTLIEFGNDVNDFHKYYSSTVNFTDAVQLVDIAIKDKIIYSMQNNALAKTQLLNYCKNCINSIGRLDNSLYNDLRNNLNGKTIKDLNTNKTYRITVELEDGDGYWQYTPGDTNWESLETSALFFLPNEVNTSYGSTELNVVTPTIYGKVVNLRYDLQYCRMTLNQITNVSVVVPKDDAGGTVYRTHLIDAPYDMFAIPFNNMLTIKDGLDEVNPNLDVTLAIANALITELGAEKVYDLQILPYCPVRQYIKSDGSFDITDATASQVQPITIGANPVNYMFWCSKSSLEDIILLDPENNLEPYSIEIADLKKSYNTELYRLCSPNFGSGFDFNAAQNGGVDYFLMSLTYKPYNPYVRVRPNFKRMFGNNYKDARGLILQGDFSLPKITNAWTEYELRNKNYLNVFNREIQSLNLQDQIGSQTDWFKAISGVITGTVGGAIGGAYTGGGTGAVVGAGIGSILSATGGALDITNNQRLRNDTITKAKELFNYQLDNIQALPNTLANVGCLIVDNPLIPVLEYYSASSEEIDAYTKKIKYYGMSVMKVGTIADYLNPLEETFIQGTLLRLLPPEGVNEEADNHLAEELSNEISKGLYIGS